MIDGTALADPQWLARRVADTARTWRHDDPRVIGTLWWYIASHTVFDEAIGALAATGRAPDPTLAVMEVDAKADGGLASVTSSRTVIGTEAYGVALRGSLEQIVPALASVSDAAQPALWAVAVDAIANRALQAGAPNLAEAISDAVGPAMPEPRFVEVNHQRFVRRASCCLIYLTGKADMCTSCPRRTPADRAGLLAARAGLGR